MGGVDRATAALPAPGTLAPVLLPGSPRTSRYVLVLEGDPISGASPQSDVHALQSRHAAVAAGVQAAGGAVVSRYEAVLNGLLVDMPHSARAQIARRDDVKRVYQAPHVAPLLAESVPYIGARRVVEEMGVDGSGAIVAIVDTGIDYTHAALGGSTDSGAYAANDPAVVEPGSFPAAKVVGGWDFAGSLYDPACAIGEEVSGRCRRAPRPDADPLDEQGHGTQVASIAAGVGVAGVSPGVAPGAGLVALKIFGAQGGSDLLLDALEWIVRARTGLPVEGVGVQVDVVNLSLGSPYATGLFEDEGIVRRVTASGVVVVAAAGNDGDRPYIAASPAVADLALAVAASYDDGEANLAVEVTWPEPEGSGFEIEGAEPDFTRPLAEVGAIVAPLAWMGSGCAGAAVIQPIRDRIALIDRTDCEPFDKIDRARDLGAVAALMFTDDRPVDNLGAARSTNLPAALIPLDDGVRLRTLLEAGTTVTASLDPARTIRHAERADRIWPPTSRGPAPGGFQPLPKPDLAAPGTSIRAAAMGTGTGARSARGTSLAAPHVAGVAALVRALHPAMPAADVARLVASAAVPIDGSRSGAGRLDAARAVVNHAFVSGDSLSSVTFGRITSTGLITHSVEVANVSSVAKRFRLAVTSPPGVGADYRVTPATLEVPAGGRAPLQVSVLITEAFGTRPGPVRGGLRVADGEALSALELRGRLSATEIDDAGVPLDGGSRVQLPLVSRLEPSSLVSVGRAAGEVTGPGGLGPATFSIVNRGLAPAPVESYLWFGNDGEDAFVDPRIDVRHVGARIARDSRGVDVLEFAATFAEPSPTPVGLALQVYVDTDGDGDLDWLVVGTDAAVLFNGEYSGEWVTVAVPFPDGAVVPDWDRAVAEFEGDVRLDGAYAVVRVRAETLGIRPGSGTPIDFFVATEDRLWSGRYLDVVDVAPGGAGLTSPDRLWRWHPGDGDLAVWPWTARIEPQGAQTVRVAAARGAADGAGPPPPGILLLYPANVQEPDVAPYFTGQAFPVIVPPHLPGVLSVIHLPAMNTTP